MKRRLNRGDRGRLTKSRNSIEVVKLEIVVVVDVGVKVASGKVVENLEVVEEAE